MPLKPIELTIRFPNDEEQDEHGEGGDEGRGHHPRPVGRALGVCALKTPRPTVSTRVLSSVTEQRPEVLVPLAEEGQQGERGEGCRRVRQHDLEEDAGMVRAVEHRGLLDLARHVQEELPHEEDRERRHEQERQQQTQIRVQEPEVAHQEEVRQGGEDAGDQHGSQERPNTTSRPFQCSRENA